MGDASQLMNKSHEAAPVSWGKAPGLGFVPWVMNCAKIQLDHIHKGLFPVLLILFHSSPPCPYAHLSAGPHHSSSSSAVSLEVNKCESPALLVFKTALATQGPLRFHMTFRMTFPISAKTIPGTLIETAAAAYF